MAVQDAEVRDRVLRDLREEILILAREGLSAREIEERVNGSRSLTADEQDLVYLLTYHAVAEARGNY
jgi:hypothetical protein